MMQKILAWFKQFNFSTHTLAVVAVVFALAYGGYKPFHDLMDSWYTMMPMWLQVFVGTGVFLFGLYKSGVLKQAIAQTPAQVAAKKASFEKLRGWTLIAVLGPGLMAACVPLNGCGVTAAQIIADAKVVTAAAETIGLQLQTVNPGLSAQILKDVTTANTAISQWNGGTVQGDIVSALTILQTVLAVIPVPQAQLVATFIPIAIAGIEAIFAALAANKQLLAPNVALPVSARLQHTQWTGYHIHHRFGRSIEGDFKAAWSKAAAGRPAMQLP